MRKGMLDQSVRRHSRRILVYQHGSLGDTILTLPALRAVRRRYGAGAEITLLHDSLPEGLASPVSLLAGGPYLDGFISYDLRQGYLRTFCSLVRLWWRLKAYGFQAVVYLAPGQRTAVAVLRDHIFFRSCGIPERVGFHAFSTDFLYPKEPDGRLRRVTSEAVWRLERLRLDGWNVSAQLEVTRPLLELPQEEIATAGAWLEANRRHESRPLVALCPGANQPANLWPLERFMELGQRILDENRAELVVIGGPKEYEIGQRLVECWGEGLNAAGRFSAIGSAALLSFCTFVVGLDTGTTHLAAAVGVCCIALYGAREHPGRWDPLGAGHIVLRSPPVPCAGCGLKICPVEGHPCMSGITVDDAWEAVQQMQDQGWNRETGPQG